MMLQVGGEDVRFKPRLIEGVRVPSPPVPERLIMDGQQRLTALFQALYSGGPAETKDSRGKPIKRWYYVDMAKALSPNGDPEEAIVGFPEDRKLRSFRGEVLLDCSTTEKECQEEFFPLPLVYDSTALTAWLMEYLKGDPERVPERLARWNLLLKTVVQPFQHYQIPVIVLRKETPKAAVCQVFERVNTGGVSLTVFELLTATYAADGFNLREDWRRQSEALKKHAVLRTVENTDFLQAVTLLATLGQALEKGATPGSASGVSCKRKEVLSLRLEEYKALADRVTAGFIGAGKLLYGQKIFSARDLPYRTQLTPLAAVLGFLGERAENDAVRRKLVRWYWCGVFGELYGGSLETRFAKDLTEILAWVDGGPEPATVNEANFAPARLYTLRTRNSAAYKGLFALLIRDGGLDFRTGQPIDVEMYFDERVDIHHVFPQAFCSQAGIDLKMADSIVNRIPLTARTNRLIGGSAPSAYLERLQKNSGIPRERMDEILRSHLIDPSHLRADDFPSFFAARAEAMLSRIEAAMGKPILRELAQVEPDARGDDEDEGLLEAASGET